MAIEDLLRSINAQDFCVTCQTTVLSEDPAVLLEAGQRFTTGECATHHETFANFRAAVEEGCYICTWVEKHALDEKEHIAFNQYQRTSRNPITTYKVLRWNTPRPQSLVFVDIYAIGIQTRFILYRSNEYPSPDCLSLRTSSRQTRSLLHFWHERCSMEHSGCVARTIKDWTPTRILDLGLTSSTIWRIRCPETEGVTVPEYTTISYRWGDVDFPKLTSQSVASFRSGLPYSSLPQVFQDAISLTKDLSIRFIWIDALCIFQDSNDDFDQECARMSSIYTNSSCNLVATFGKDPYTSLFRTRNYETLNIGKYQYTCKLLEPVPKVWLGFDSMVHERHLSREMLNCEIASRGWVLQELLLAPRAVFFGMNQVHWMCRGLQACEIWPGGNPPRITTEMSSRLTERYFDFHKQSPGYFWKLIVNRFSTLTLSNTADKLPALSGVAKFFMQQTQDEYFAGHWKSTLPLSLIWHIPANVQYFSGWMARFGVLTSACGCPSAEYRAPSWSWASIDGVVNFPIMRDDETVTVLCSTLNVHVDTAGGDQTGSVVDGQITIRAPWATEKVLRDIELKGDVHHAEKELIWDSALITDHTVEFAAVAVQYFQAEQSPKGDDGPRMAIHGLILLPTHTNTGRYRRVGAFRVESGLGQRAVLDVFSLKLGTEKVMEVTVKNEASLRDFEVV